MVGVYEQRRNYPNRFSYVAGVEVKSLSEIPKGMIPKIVNGSKYAVFNHQGDICNIDKTYNYIYEEWLPESKYEKNVNGDNLEAFNLEFSEDDNSDVDLYIAIIDQE